MESEGGTNKKTETEEKNQNNVLETDETKEERHDKNPGEEDTVSQHKDSPSPIDTEEGASTLEKEKGAKDDDDLPNIENSQLETSTHLSRPEEGLVKPTVEDTVQHSIVSSQVSSGVLENESDTALVHEETTTTHLHANTVMEQEEGHGITSPGDNNETPDTTKLSEVKGSPLLQHHANNTVMEQDMLASGDHTEFPDTKVVEVNSETIDEASDMNLADHERGTTTEFENQPGSETVSNLDNNPSQPLIETSVNVENELVNDQNSHVLPAGVSEDCDKGTSSDHNEGGATLEPEPMEAMELDVPDSKLVTDASIDSTINNNDVNVEAPNAEKKDYSIVLIPEGSGADNEIASVTREAGPPCVPSSDTKSEVGVSESLNNGVHKIGPPKRSFLSDDTSEGNESGTEEDRSAFTKELSQFFRERNMDFKPPKFYGEGLNCLKLWRAVVRLGGYDKVTGFKLWRQVGESFRPPKTCTTVSWTFRGFYEKTLLEYERQKVIAGELQIPLAIESEPMNIDNQASGSGRARRDAAARAMQGWHSQLLNGNGEVNEPAIQDNNLVLHQKREKSMGTSSPGLMKRKRLTSTEHVAKHAIQVSRPMLDVTVVDVGPPAQWVKINVQRTQDCFEVYALVPGLVREEVRVQSDPAGRLVISGEPENPMNPWGATPFKKVVSLPTRIDPHHTSAVVTLNGQLFVRVPLEQSD